MPNLHQNFKLPESKYKNSKIDVPSVNFKIEIFFEGPLLLLSNFFLSNTLLFGLHLIAELPPSFEIYPWSKHAHLAAQKPLLSLCHCTFLRCFWLLNGC